MKLSVWLVEDHPLNRELACDLLQVEGHQVTVAVDGAAFRRLLEGGPSPSIVLMDIGLPDADGVALLGELRALPRYSRVPVVALTAHALAGDEARYRAAGFDLVLTKPIQARTFVAAIERLAGEKL